jgi:hypothetical protein
MQPTLAAAAIKEQPETRRPFVRFYPSDSKGRSAKRLLPLLRSRARPRPAAAARHCPTTQRFRLFVREVKLANAFALIGEADPHDGAFALGDLLAALVGHSNCLASHLGLL